MVGVPESRAKNCQMRAHVFLFEVYIYKQIYIYIYICMYVYSFNYENISYSYESDFVGDPFCSLLNMCHVLGDSV